MATGLRRQRLFEYKVTLPGFMIYVYQADALAQVQGDWQLQELNNEGMADQ